MCFSEKEKPAGRTAPRRQPASCVFYDRSNLGDIPAGGFRNLTPAQLAYIRALIADGPGHYIDNIPADVAYGLIACGNEALPFTVSSGRQTVFSVSPVTCYFSYPLLIEGKEFGRRDAPAARLVLRLLERYARFDRTVALNNWFMTNNPTPCVSAAALSAFAAALTCAYPRHLLIVKSAPATDPTGLLAPLRELGFDLINWRICHYWIPEGPLRSKRTKQFRIDRRLLETTPLETGWASELSNAEAARCEELYQKLYIGKHTGMNVQLNRRWFALTCNTGFLDYFTIREGGCIKAFAISYEDPVGINTGFLGYDLDGGRDLGLYRMAVVSKILRGFETGRTVNLSTGVSRFKELRGAAPFAEYEALYYRSLSWPRRALLRLFVRAYNAFGGAIRSR